MKSQPMTARENQLLAQLKKLPPAHLAEVADFVDFLATREELRAAIQTGMGSGPSIPADDVFAELNARYAEPKPASRKATGSRRAA